jgi:hypothetical protein
MFKIIQGLFALEKGMPYLIVTVNMWQDQIIELKQFVFVVGHDETSITTVYDLKTEIGTKLGLFPEKGKSGLEKLLESELGLAKQNYSKWLYEQIGEKAFAQVRTIVWEDYRDIMPFAVMYFKLKEESRQKIIQLAQDTRCGDLKDFISKVLGLRLAIEKTE